MKKKKSIKKLNIVLAYLIILLFTLPLTLLNSILIFDNHSSFSWFLLSLILALFIVVNIHEFGHFIIGKKLNFKLLSYRIGCLSFDNQNGKMHFSIKRNKGYSGLCAMIPCDDSMKKMTWYYSGGVLINLITGLLFFLIGMQSKNLNGNISTLFISFGTVSILLFIANILPYSIKSFLNDGALLYNTMFKTPYYKTLTQLTRAQALLATGTRPRELQVSLDTDDEFEMTLYIYKYLKAVDTNNQGYIKKLIFEIEENIKKANAYNLPSICCKICFQACLNGDTDKAKTYYNKCIKAITKDKDANGMRVKAYYEYYVNKDTEKAKEHCEKGLEVVDKYPIPGIALYEKDLLLKLQEQINA